MAQRRMFAKTIVDSDAFLDMPLSTQALYFHLSMRADDEGFLNNAKTVQRLVRATDDDLSMLVGKRFIIPFQTGIVVIKHWKIHNYIQKDRLKPTVYNDEKAMLGITENKSYTLLDNALDTKWTQNGYNLDTQVSIGKVRLGKESIGKVSKGKKKKNTPTPNKKPYGDFQNVLLTDNEYGKLKKLFLLDYEAYIGKLDLYIESSGKKYKSHYATLRQWLNRDGKVAEELVIAEFDEKGNIING